MTGEQSGRPFLRFVPSPGAPSGRLARPRHALRRHLASALALLVLSALAPVGRADAQATRPQEGFTANTLPVPANDDGSAGPVPLGFTVDFFGLSFSNVFVNNNGNVTFDAALPTFTPFDLTATQRQIIAPFFADVDTRGSGSGVVTYGTDLVDGRLAFGVNWFGVGYYEAQTDKLNTFQLVLIDRSDTGPGNFDFEFNYDQIEWETGSASGGVGGLGGSSARAGFSNGTGDPESFFELDGSAVPGSFLDSSSESGLIHGRINSEVDGRYVFQVRAGTVVLSTSIKASNTAGIGVPSGIGEAGVYPSPIGVSGTTAGAVAVTAARSRPVPRAVVVTGTPGRIRKLTVTVRNLTYSFAADLDLLLVGPGGQTVVLMSDAGGNFPLDGLTLTFDDDAELALPATTPLRSGTYRPTNRGALMPDSPFPDPAPEGPYGTSLAAFRGTDPIGTWELYVRDDLTGDAGSIEQGWELNILTGPLAPTPSDLDGDGTADPALYRGATAVWTVQRSLEGLVTGVAFGEPVQGDVPVPGDYDHDGVTDVAVYRPATGEWFARRSSNGSRLDFTFGPPVPGDVPIPADYDGDGSADPAIYRAATGAFLIRRSSDGSVITLCCAAPGDVPMPADYDGDGKADLAVYRPTPGAVLMLRSSDGTLVQVCCADAVGDLLIPADYDGDGRADLAKYRPTTGEFTILRSSDFQLVRLCCGDPAAGDLPVAADYDGDGKADVAVYRVTTGNFHILRSTDGTLQTVALGTPGQDLPAIRAFQAPQIPAVPPPPSPPPDPEPDPEEPTPPPAPCKPDPESFFPGC